MKLNVPHIAKLANLSLTKNEEKKFEKQLTNVLEYIEKLEEIDTKNVMITSQVTGLENVTRDDISAESLSQAAALSNTKSQHNGLFKVKAILDNG